jgi:D-alanyl-lipoteichoic acid acyltransferase DltB (MBOAT superfamily)
MYEGLRLMLWGLFKKVVIADRLSFYVDAVYGNPQQHSGLNLLIGTLFFAIQIYCDFSGYSDMAIGAAKVMGFKLMTNFNRPYFARNIQEFWKRWHISLSTWFRDYVYISLGGNRVSKSRVYLNVILVFLLSGFWHGANWTFVIWGGVHALLIVSYMLFRQYVRQRLTKNNWLANTAATLLTFAVVCLAWIFFRAGSATEAIYILSAILKGGINNFEFIVNSKGVEFGVTSTLISIVMIGILLLNDHFQNVFQTALNNKKYKDILFNGLYFSWLSFLVYFKKQVLSIFSFNNSMGTLRKIFLYSLLP